MKVLVAEDDLASGKFMQKLLSKYGEVVLARDGIAAVDEFVNAVSTNERFDLICMDIMMPKLDGIAATKAIRAMERPDAVEIPIIAMTANAFEEDRKKALAKGMNGHIAKPVDAEKLKKIILSALR